VSSVRVRESLRGDPKLIKVERSIAALTVSEVAKPGFVTLQRK
jgi:hypothetical protein